MATKKQIKKNYIVDFDGELQTFFDMTEEQLLEEMDDGGWIDERDEVLVYEVGPEFIVDKSVRLVLNK